MAKPRVFIGSSAEGLEAAEAIQASLAHAAEVTIWTQDVFGASRYPLESILEAAATADFGIFVFTPDDPTTIRDREVRVARDNVIFEFGLFVAAVGRTHAFVVRPDDAIHIPTDLEGLTLLGFDASRNDGNLMAALGPACAQIKKALNSYVSEGPCGYLVRFASREEPSLLTPNCDTQVSYERFYKLLLYMFRHESFRKFRAFDLAFGRWEELLRTDQDQTLNISNEIFEAMTQMFGDERCRDFRRILVIPPEQLQEAKAQSVLERIDQREASWRDDHPALNVETRVLVYPPASNRETRRRIRELHDFAVFDGERDKLSLIETSLSSPTDNTAHPVCRVVASSGMADELDSEFDAFWHTSATIPDILERLRSSSDADQDASRPARQAFDTFRKGIGQETGCALIIEAGYIEARQSRDEDRSRHLDDAFWLRNAVHDSYPALRGSVFLEAFVNDLNSGNVCQIEECGIDVDSADEEGVIDTVMKTLDQRYALYDLGREDFELFGMKRTRNKATETIKRSVGAREGIGERRQPTGEAFFDIYAETSTGWIELAYRDAGSSRVTALCSALMAQHYFDLLNHARQKCADLRELWIFDFNLLTEQEPVRRGAEAAFVLYSWPEDVKIHVVNCIYAPDATTGTIQLIQGPR